MFEFICWVILAAIVAYYILRPIGMQPPDQQPNQFGYVSQMSLKNAILVVELTDIDNENKVWYVGECHNPESTVAHDVSFCDFIFHSSCYEDKDKALRHAEELQLEIRSRFGVLVYDGYSNYTFGQIASRFNPAAVQPQ